MSLSRIIEAAENQFNAYQKDCSGFLKKVAEELFIDLPNYNANGLYDYLVGSPEWENLGKGQAGMALAVERAFEGLLVVAAKKETGHGHVAIIVGVDKDGTPIGYWGSIAGIGKKNARLTNSWSKRKFADISYFAYLGVLV